MFASVWKASSVLFAPTQEEIPGAKNCLVILGQFQRNYKPPTLGAFPSLRLNSSDVTWGSNLGSLTE